MGKELDRSKWQNNVMSINESKAGDLYIKVSDKLQGALILYPGDTLQMKGKQENLDEALEAGRMTAEQHAELSEKLSFIKYEITAPPTKES